MKEEVKEPTVGVFDPNEDPKDPMEVDRPNPVPYYYDKADERVVAITKQVADFCGYDLKSEVEIVEDEGTSTGGSGNSTSAGDGDNENTENTTESVVDEGEEIPIPDDETITEEPSDELDEYEEDESLKTDPAELWPKIWQAIRYISNLTCWTDRDDDTFLTQIRRQNYEAATHCACCPTSCCCDEDQIVITLDYTPNPDNMWIGGRISAVVNGKLVVEDIDAKYLEDHYDYYTGKLYIMRADFPQILLDHSRCCCLRERKVNIGLEYLAGYDRIPDGLLPLICPIINKINESKIGMSDCHQAMTQVSGLLKRKKSGNVEYEWSTVNSDTQKTQTLYTDLYNIANVDEVMAISRCAMVDDVKEIGDVV